jgi:hypothetical protein
MGFRFFRRIKIVPGVTLNVSKSGVSTSLGGKGAHVTIGHGRTRSTVGIPGTGMSYTDVTHPQARSESQPVKRAGVPGWLFAAASIGAAVAAGFFMK